MRGKVDIVVEETAVRHVSLASLKETLVALEAETKYGLIRFKYYPHKINDAWLERVANLREAPDSSVMQEFLTDVVGWWDMTEDKAGKVPFPITLENMIALGPFVRLELNNKIWNDINDSGNAGSSSSS